MAIPKALQPWMNHLNKVRKAHPNLSMKEAMILAKKSYKKPKKGGSSIFDKDALKKPIGIRPEIQPVKLKPLRL